MRKIDKLNKKHKVLTFDLNQDDIYSSNENMPHLTAKQEKNILDRTNWAKTTNVPYVIGADVTDENQGIFDKVLLALSWILMFMFFPLSLFITLKVVQEYE